MRIGTSWEKRKGKEKGKKRKRVAKGGVIRGKYGENGYILG